MSDRNRNIRVLARVNYNKVGVGAFSMRELSRLMDISPGNLTYHFPTQEHLIKALLAEAEQAAEGLKQSPAKTVKDLYHWLESFFAFQLHFKFLYMDRRALYAACPDDHNRLDALYALHLDWLKATFEKLNERSMLKNEPYDDQHEGLVDALCILLEHWPLRLQEGKPPIPPRKAIWALIYRDLEKSGKRGFKVLRPEIELLGPPLPLSDSLLLAS